MNRAASAPTGHMADSPGEGEIGGLILASRSPRRSELLRQAGYRFATKPPGPVEDRAVPKAPTPGAYVESLAYLKARSAIETHRLAKGLVLGADTAVELDGHILGKPRDEADARQILTRLAGTTHRVLTGLALVEAATGQRRLAHAATTVHMRPMSAEEIEAYVTSGAAMEKAGAYGVQETADGSPGEVGDRYVQRIEGSFTNLVGLPMELLERLLKAMGYDPQRFRD